MNIDNTEVSFFTSECALFEYAIKDNDNISVSFWHGGSPVLHAEGNVIYYY